MGTHASESSGPEPDATPQRRESLQAGSAPSPKPSSHGDSASPAENSGGGIGRDIPDETPGDSASRSPNQDAESRQADRDHGDDPSGDPGGEADRPAAEDAVPGTDELPDGEDGLADAKTVITSSRGSSVPSHPAGSGSPAEVAEVLLGHQLGHFELETLIGGGGMGAVFRARDARLDRIVALKVIPRVGDDPELQRRFRNEAQSAARLDHPNIARVYDVGRQGGWHYIVFEYIDGTNLRDLVERDGLLSVDDAVFYTRQVAEALDHAFRRGVTHRDIKPSNVLITPSGQVKLVDMGLARAQQLEVSDDMTASGVTLGTFDYISPEQAKDPRDADVRSDIYSLGCTLYFALTGRPPYVGGTVLQKLLSHGSSPPPDPRTVRPGLSENLVAVLHKMLAKQPADRYRRPLDLIADLYQLAERENLPRALSAGSIAVVPESRFAQLLEHHLPWVVAATLLVLSTAWLQLLSSAGGDLTVTEPVPATPAAADGSSVRIGPDGNGSASGQQGTATVAGDPENDASTTTDEDDAEESQPTDAATEAPRFYDVADPSGNQDGPEATIDAAAESTNRSADSASASGALAQATVVRIVGPLPVPTGRLDRENRWLVASLEDALAAAVENPGIEAIEIGAARIRSGPVTWPRKGLELRGVGDESVLELVGPPDAEAGRVSLIQLGSNSLDVQDLHLVWKVPFSRSDGGCLFELAGGNTVRFKRSSITIASAAAATTGSDSQSSTATTNSASLNVDADDTATSIAGQAQAAGVYAFQMLAPEADQATESVVAAAAEPPPLVAIQMTDSVVRGEMTMLALGQAALVELLWENGLLAISGRMIETGGAALRSTSGPVQTRMILDDVTAAADGGLVAVHLGERSAEPIIVDREANRSVFTLAGTTPLIQLNGYLPGEIDRYLVLRGRDNYYDSTAGRTQTVVSATPPNAGDSGGLPPRNADRPVDGGSFETAVGISRLLSSDRPDWMKEVSPQGIVVWRDPPPRRQPHHRRTPEDYRQEGVLLPGFRLSALPRLPMIFEGDLAGGI